MSRCSHSKPSTFLLMGIPGLGSTHFWIAFLLCAMYVVALLGNFTLLFVMKTEPNLHLPMYYFLCMLAGIDLVLTTSTMPKIMGIFWFHSYEIGFECCVVQMFFIHSFSAMESGVLLAMAFDRYVANCKPLRYSAIFTNAVIAKIGSATIVRGISQFTPLMCMVNHLSYSGSRIISHSHCEQKTVVKLACGDTTPNYVYGITAVTIMVGSDFIFIAISYILILQAILSLSSRDMCLKSFSTCGSHVCVILVFYTPALFSFFTHRWGQNIPTHIHILLADLYLSVPPMLSPIIYGMKTKQIRGRVLRPFYPKRPLQRGMLNSDERDTEGSDRYLELQILM